MVRITGEMIINDVVNSTPITMPVFNKHNLDTCCGGGVPISEGARVSGANLGALLDDLNNVLVEK